MYNLRNIDIICANKNTPMLIECFSKLESWQWVTRIIIIILLCVSVSIIQDYTSVTCFTIVVCVSGTFT